MVKVYDKPRENCPCWTEKLPDPEPPEEPEMIPCPHCNGTGEIEETRA